MIARRKEHAMQTKNLAELYHLDTVPWSVALKALESDEHARPTRFLTTKRPDGRPHVAGVGALWDEGKVYVVSGPKTRKSKNLAKNPECVIAMSLVDIDLVIEGKAERVTDEATLQRVAKRYGQTGWPVEVKDGAFTYDYSAPSAGPPPWHLYAITPQTVYGVLSTAPGGASRWRF
jgi:hypothetical protein